MNLLSLHIKDLNSRNLKSTDFEFRTLGDF